ncbi:nuclear transport factor 2 family protein [Paraflavitalea sp. CAU 1676]|uniref:nuclear transport factor 2 family protein n=1 Tax=Paraflavitalea sp. CAU 1676 TaxID=3032598 RepID=UPI0023D9B49E|nr:nuclear transport factor 2 family protein [Paraflavitalea sp. CAU 1676]MDF2187953.1 nuclear transport factor 2 family protein [Paraflavitalea sp. CAU 1676]
MDNRKIITEFLDAFDKNDLEGILSHIAEDASWDILNDQKIVGKEALRKFFYDNQNMKVVSATREHFIVDGDRASVGGEAICKNMDSGDEYDMYYCDVYGLKNGKINNMVTYTINKKK